MDIIKYVEAMVNDQVQNKTENAFYQERESFEEKYNKNPMSFFPECPENAKKAVENLISLRSSDEQFFGVGGWETIKGIDGSTPKHHYKGLVEAQIRREDRAYLSFLVRSMR